MPQTTKDFLSEWGIILPPRDTRVPETAKALRKLQRLLGEVETRPPSAQDLQSSLRQLETAWRTHRSLTRVPRRVLKDFPWAVFQPWARDGHDLPYDQEFISAYREWLKANRSGRHTARLIPPYLRGFPEDKPFREAWRRTIAGILLDGNDRARLSLWRERHEKMGILAEDGPQLLAQKILAEPDDYSAILGEAGLTGFLEDSEFVRVTFRSLLQKVSTRLNTFPMISEEESTALLSILESRPGTLRFADMRVEVTEALLNPWLERSPPEAVRVSVRSFLQRILGNPNIRRNNWVGIDPPLRQVFLRWLAEETLETFFQILSGTAKARHWEQRQTFWRRYLDTGFISDAWLALGPDAASLVQNITEVPRGSWAELKGSQASQSVILFRIRNLTIMEWSHDGAGRIWIDGTQTAPSLYRRRYSGPQLRSKYDYRFRHIGNWQWETETWIRRQTGIRPRRL